MIIETAAQAAAVSHLALEFNIVPEMPPGANGFIRIVNLLLWAVVLACVAALIYGGGKFAWEKYMTGRGEAGQGMVWALVGAVVAYSANQILNAVVA